MAHAQAEEIIGQLGRRQHGALSLHQLVEAGVPLREVERRLERGQLVRCGSATYVVNGTPRSTRQRMHIACLASSGAAVLSHETAAHLLGFSYVPRGLVVLTVGLGAQHRLPADRVHRKSDLRPPFVTTIDGLPLTTRARTLIDLAAVLGWRRLERILDDQLSSGLLTYLELVAVFNAIARRGRRGIGKMRPLLEVRGEGYVAASSELEQRFIELVRAHGLPEPTRQHLPPWAIEDGIGRVDFAYPDRRLLIEVDGRRWHSRDSANEEDRYRDQLAVASGWRVLRYTWTQIAESSAYVADNLRATLARAAA